MIIAVAGKGGSGKTTLAGLIIRYLVRSGKVPVLAVDADPNSNLADSIGLQAPKTIGQVNQEFLDGKQNLPPGMHKQGWLDLKLNEALGESKGVDIVVMGRPEGSGCYCSANAVLKEYLEKLAGNYSYVVVDNEAGMEHLSRRTTQEMDVLFMVSEPTIRGIRTVGRLDKLVKELNLKVKNRFLILDRVNGDIDSKLSAEIDKLNVDLLATIPQDEEVLEYDLLERSLIDLPETSPAAKAVEDLMEKVVK